MEIASTNIRLAFISCIFVLQGTVVFCGISIMLDFFPYIFNSEQQTENFIRLIFFEQTLFRALQKRRDMEQ